MQLFELILMAVVQGLTEFLPVSSSGHLVLLQQMTETYRGDVTLAIVLHLGTLAAVLAVYRREVLRLLRFDAAALQYVVALVIGTLPAVAAGLLVKDLVESLFDSPRATGFALLATGLLLLSTRAARNDARRPTGDWHPVPPSPLKALLVGCAQALAITPGVSRSGATIAASLWLGIEREEAARFSFLLSVPAILGAAVLDFLDAGMSSAAPPLWLVLGAALACVVGVVAIRLTALLVVQRHFWKFAFYTLPLGIVVLLVV